MFKKNKLMGVLLVSYIIVLKQTDMGVLKRQIYGLIKRDAFFLEAYIGVPKRLHMSVSTLPYGYVLTHLHRCVL